VPRRVERAVFFGLCALIIIPKKVSSREQSLNRANQSVEFHRLASLAFDDAAD